MGFANKISLSRILIIPFFIATLFYYSQHSDQNYLRWVVLGIFGFAMISDFLDGIIARVKKERTDLGKVLDPLADKLLLLNAFIWIYHLQNSLPVYPLPVGVVILVISRDLIILIGLLILYLLKVEIPIAPNLWGKLTTFFQLVTILSVILNFSFSPVLWAAACIFTVISGVIYVKRGVVAINVLDNRNHHSRNL